MLHLPVLKRRSIDQMKSELNFYRRTCQHKRYLKKNNRSSLLSRIWQTISGTLNYPLSINKFTIFYIFRNFVTNVDKLKHDIKK